MYGVASKMLQKMQNTTGWRGGLVAGVMIGFSLCWNGAIILSHTEVKNIQLYPFIRAGLL